MVLHYQIRDEHCGVHVLWSGEFFADHVPIGRMDGNGSTSPTGGSGF